MNIESTYIIYVSQPLSLMPIVGCCVPSSVASSKTLRNRSQQLGRVREVVSGGSRCEQLQDELGHMTKEDREAILCEAALPVKIPTDHGLALKSDFQLPWNKMRAIHRYKDSRQMEGRKALTFLQY